MAGGLGTTALAFSGGRNAAALAGGPPEGMPQAIISWSMAERTVRIENLEFKDELYNGERHWMIEGPDGEPGLYGGVSSVPLDQIDPPDGYEVTLNGCASTGKIQQYEWKIDGRRVSKSKACRFTTRLLEEQSYRVELVVNGGGRKNSATEDVEPNDLLIVIMGDSYTSGEGNGLKYDADMQDTSLDDATADNGRGWSEGAFWDYANCHRSTRSGQANAAIDLERADPHTSVTTLYPACSGAQIDSGILGVKDGNLGGAEKPQTWQAYELTKMNGRDRDIDAVIMGIGGNDIGFVPIVTEGVLQPDAFLSTLRSPILPGDPKLPVTSETPPVAEEQLPFLLLAPDEDYVDIRPVNADPLLPPLKVLDPMALHACDSQYQKATMGLGGIGPDGPITPCRESIGTSEFGLAQVNACLTGTGSEDCVFARSYFIYTDFDNQEGEWTHKDGASVGVPDRWPGLRVAPGRVFYTEYPDLTTEFVGPPAVKEYQFCEITITDEKLTRLLKLLARLLDNPDLIDRIEAIIEGLKNADFDFGLPQNEFQWASEAILNGPIDPEIKALMLDLTLTPGWRVRTGTGGAPLFVPEYTLIGKEKLVDFVNLGNDAPALNEMTALSAGVYSWNAVTGTHDLASGHGLCTDEPTGLNDDVAAYAYLIAPLQGTNASGSAHPNLLGQQAYRGPLAAALKAELLHD